MTTTTDLYRLTADDLTAFKMGRNLVVFWTPDRANEEAGRPAAGIHIIGELRFDDPHYATKARQFANGDIWTVEPNPYYHEYRRYVPATARISTFNGGPFRGASWVDLSYLYGDTTASLIKLLRVGDALEIKFLLGNNSENHRSIGWVQDEVYVSILRKRANSSAHAEVPMDRFVTMLLDTYNGPDNSARMGQR